MSEPSRSPAAAALGLPAAADAAAVRTAFLKKLAETDFVPPEDATAAVNRLARGRLPLSGDGRQEAARFEAADLEAFVARFWQLAPADRTRVWERLDKACSDAAARETLARLQPALAVAVVRHEDWPADQMASFIRETFLLPPRERAVQRMEWLADQTFGPTLAARVRYLRERDAGTALLDPQLIQDLLLAQAEPLAVPALSQEKLDKIAAKEERAARKAARKAELRTEQPANTGSAGGWKFSWHYLWLLAIVGRLAVGLGSRGTTTTTPLPTSSPAFNPSPTQTSGFTAQQIREYQAYLQGGAGKPTPPGYSMWVLAGRPATPTPPGKR